MSDFRKALDAYAEGKLELSGVERELNLGLARQPHLAAAHGALVEALYRSGRIAGSTYLSLTQAIRAFQQSQPQVTVQVVPTAAPVAGGAQDKTQFRAPGAASQAAGGGAGGASAGGATGAMGAAGEDAEKTQFRAPRAAGSAAPSAPGSVAASAPGSVVPPATPGHASTDSSVPADPRVPTDSRIPTGSRPTNSNWSDLGRFVAEGVRLSSGSVVKERFVLEEELGRGGMGIVFKARDLRKEEAQDRNPWVAIKLLNEEFRRHPESLKALQRESRKAQQLAHANVVTVYDFDRDGSNVFMVMELLEGQSLDRIIRDNESSGLEVAEALRLTRDMCRAMAYAHDKGVVHSDFKPANAFVTREGVVKVFDFGIARAAKRADNVSGSTTLFDPGTLGALTPTYASCEMIEGLEPDSRDDVYAIACVAYELLAGKHPFNRVSAVEARDKHMVAKRPRGLKRNQWRAIQHGLQFDRENRTASAQQFLSELLPQKRRSAAPIGIAAVVVIGLVVAGFLVPSYMAKRRERAFIDSLTTAQAARLDALVQQLRDMTPDQRAAILLNEGARSGLIKAFERRIDMATEPGQATPDYPGARVLLGELQAFLPDSLAVKDLQDRLSARENDEIKRLSDRFDEYLKHGVLLDVQGVPNIGTALAAIRRIDAQNRLLSDPRLPGAFAEQTRHALQAGNPNLAQALVTAGLAFDSGDTTLTDLRDQVRRAVGTQQLVARRQSLESSLAALAGPRAAFADVDGKRADLEELRSIAPDSQVLSGVQQLTQRGVSAQTAQLVGAGQYAQALELIARYADLLPVSFVDQQRQKLASVRGALEAQQAAAAQIEARIDALLKDQKLDAAWATQLDRELRQLAAYVSENDAFVTRVKTRAAEGYLAQARAFRGSQRLTEAGRMLEQMRVYAPQSAELAAEAKLLADAHTAQETAAQVRNHLAQLDALRTKLLVQASANEVNEALASLQELRANPDANDGFIVVQAPAAIGGAYLRLASNAAKDGRFANAVSLTGHAKEVAPELQDLASASERYARYLSLDQTLKTGNTVDATSTRNELDRLGRQDAGEAAAVKETLARDLVARIRATSDASVVQRLTNLARDVFGDQAAVKSLLQPQAAPQHAPGSASQSGGAPGAGEGSTCASDGSAAGGVGPGCTGAGGVGAGGAGAGAAPAAGGVAGGTSATASGTAGSAGGSGTGAAGSGSGTGLGGGAAGGNSSASRAGGQNNSRLAMSRPGQPGSEQAGTARVPSEIPCADRLAGYGKRKQAVCYDTFDGGGRGPDLVVIPAGGGVAKPLAIGRTEVSNADYAAYCSRTGHCAPPTGAPEYPATGISIEDARAYVGWLSQVTGAVYRLPTDGEWTYAVTAQGGNTDVNSVNCLVEIGGKKVRGVALEPVQSGSPNGWGLYNTLGNAQEWVVSGGAALAQGGAFSDNMSSCTPDSKRPHANAGDSVTGLRVIRELP
jgi:serine/threonine protein kinase